MITLENLNTGTALDGDELEFFVDDETMIGEVYLDGELIYQDMDIANERLLRMNFYRTWCELDTGSEFEYA